MAWDPPWDTAIHGSHAPGVGAGEPRASAATRRVEGAPAAAAAHGDGPDVLGRAVEALEELAEFAADGAARDRGRLAPAGVQALLGVEESTPTRSARRSEEHTSELQSRPHLVCRLLLEKKKCVCRGHDGVQHRTDAPCQDSTNSRRH